MRFLTWPKLSKPQATVLILFAGLIFLSCLHAGIWDFQIFNDWLEQLQSLCVQGYVQSHHAELLGALVCGRPPAPGQTLTDWGRAGLLSILIGAGTHFIFLEQFLNHLLKRHPALLRTTLFLFVCVTGFSPALTRSLCSQYWQELNHKWKLGLTFPKIWIVSLLTCLMLSPHWIESIGFVMSAQCGLLMYLAFQILRGRTKRVRRTTGIIDRITTHFFWTMRFWIVRITIFAIGLFPLLKILGLPVVHPFAMIIQFFGIPIAGMILFPVGIAERVIPAFIVPMDSIWDWIVALIHQISLLLPPTFRPTHNDPNFTVFQSWSYVASFYLLAYLMDMTRRYRLRLLPTNEITA